MLLIFLFTFFLPQQTIDPYESISDQAYTYVQNIESDTESELSFWGLNELYSSNCSINKIVSRIISQSSSVKLRKIFLDNECSSIENKDSLKIERLKTYTLETGSFANLINYLSLSLPQKDLDDFHTKFNDRWLQNLSSNEIDLLNAVKNKESISIDEIDSGYRVFVLYSLLFSENVYSYFDSEEFSLILTELNIEKDSNYSELKKSFLYFNLLKAAYDTNRYQFITDIFDKIIDSNLYPHSEKKVGVFSGLDYALSVTGSYSESLYLQRNILIPLASHYKLKDRVDYTLVQQSANLYNIGKYNDAKEILEGLYNDPNSSIPNSQLYNNLSLCYKQLGQKNKYTSFLLEAIQELEKNQTQNSTYYTLKLGLYRNLFVYYNSIGDSANAISYINSAKDLAEQQADKNELSVIYLYLGEYYWKNFKNVKETLKQYTKAESLSENIDNYERKLDILKNKSSLFIEIDSLEAAMSSILQIRTLASQYSNTPSPAYIESLILEGEVANLQNELSKLQSVLETLKNHTFEHLSFEVLIRYHNLHATLLHKKSKNREAYTYLKPNLDQIIERAKGSVDTQTGFWTVEKEYLDTFELMISILSELNYKEESVAYLDKLKTINDASLYNNPLLKASKLTEKELAEDKKLTARIQSLRNDYLSADENMKSALKTEIDKLSAQQQLLTNKVAFSQTEESIPIWKVQQQMNKNEIILHYTELNEKLYVNSISKKSIDLAVLEISEQVGELLNSTANELASGNTSLKTLYNVYQVLGLHKIPDFIDHITVIPDNELYRIPLEVLPTKKPNTSYSYGSSHYMIEDFNFKYFTSLQDYLENNRNTSGSLSTDFSAFAISYFDDFQEKLPSLPFATQEAREIQRVLTSFKDKQVFSGNGATEQAFQDQLNSSKILHVATHSEVSARDPLFSTIYLKSAQSNGTEGNALYAYELFDNQLSNDLIMLNSCSSGTGNYLQGTGIMGISRALRYAGAKSLALNLWEVNDKIAAEFATNFYSYLNEGYSKSEAMRLAKINQIKTGSADPHYWGAYTLIGNSNPVIKKPASSQFILPFLITMGLLVGYKVRKNSSV
ncbi:MAG: CHAT domain-containing protein [Balneola sp.]|nr:CHAT domain-containing protein [Balneola sp.]